MDREARDRYRHICERMLETAKTEKQPEMEKFAEVSIDLLDSFEALYSKARVVPP